MSLQGRILDTASALPLEALPELERRAIRLLRLWRAGPAGIAEARAEMGPDAACALDALVRRLFAPGLRPLRFSAPGARLAAGDEGLIARAMSLAAAGALEEAARLLSLAVRAPAGPETARRAGAFGRLLELPAPCRRPQAYLIAGRPVRPGLSPRDASAL